MNNLTWDSISKYNKATAAAVSQALVQLVAAFVQFPPDLEQAIGIVLTSVLVFLVPNGTGAAREEASQRGPDGLLVAHLPAPALAAAVALSLVLAGCGSLVSGDSAADKVLGADCGPESRVLRAQALTDGIGRTYPDLQLDGMRQSLGLMAEAVEGGRRLDEAAMVFQHATLTALAPMILAKGWAADPVWQSLLYLPPVAVELVRIRQQVAAFCATA